MKRRLSPSSSCSSSSSSSSCINDDKSLKVKRKKKTPNSTDENASTRRSSIYRGVTRHRWTGRFEAHLWDKTTWNNIQNKKGRQIYLGAYDNEEAAARTYDLAALKYWGPAATLNFPKDRYKKEIEEMENLTKEEYLASLRRRSSGFSRGVSKYRGVARHHHNGRWEARIGRVLGNKYLYLGTYGTQEEAAEAYDMAAIEYRGANAVTNFDISTYADRLKNILPPKTPPAHDPPKQAAANSPDSKKDDHFDIIKCEETQKQEAKEEQLLMPEIHEFPEELHPWSLCLDSGYNHNPIPLPHIPFDKSGELLDLFDDTGFEDNIDIIFDCPGNEFHHDHKLGGGNITSPSLSCTTSLSSPS